ncbi:MAG: hypothetical protein MO846_10115 [Candidatus Devosia symbiotica]|nr:hypothetical protein [Candidatus Devosia symbiotica]
MQHPGNIITYRVDVTQSDQPIGDNNFEHTAEQYYLNYDPAVDVLETTMFSGEFRLWRKNVVMPVMFTSMPDRGPGILLIARAYR